jgi:SAM-dependent methyltransferase
VGVEFEETFADSNYARQSPKADVVYSGARLPFDDASFDTVLSNQVGEHVPDPGAFFAELARVLRPGGRLILTVPFSHRIHSEPHDYHRFTKYALAEHARRVRLTVERLTPRGGFWAVIGQKLTSQMAVRYAGLKGDIQSIGGFGYEGAVARRPRYWTLPALAPLIVGVAAAAKMLDRIDFDETDTLGYLLIASRPPPE